jgi:predicted nucleic acid-binding protein
VIFIDANIFIRALVNPATSHDRDNAQRASEIFRKAGTGEIELTTSDAIVAEVAFILTSPRHYHISRSDAASYITILLSTPGIQFGSHEECLDALSIWTNEPKLSFPDALAAAYSIRRGHLIATFDGRLSRTPGVKVVDFDAL